MAFAHLAGAGGTEHELVQHLADCASRAGRLAKRAREHDAAFTAMAQWAGWLHDLGKYRDEFQDYLHGRRGKSLETQHAVFGAARAAAMNLPCAVILSILGHHAGLPNLRSARERVCDPSLDPLGSQLELARRLDRDRDRDRKCGSPWPATVAEFLAVRRGLEATYAQELQIRMLFSCLVDADYLDTETHMTGHERASNLLDARALLDRLDRHVGRLSQNNGASEINAARARLYRACRAAGDRPQGLFRLTAPTGSGKTLAMMAFALRHAQYYKLDRVIIVLPFLAIIEQNTRVYREALGVADDPGVLVEHHSAVRLNGDDEEPSDSESADVVRSKQAVENWDAPVIVTTAVQFLESLFARKPRACRKLHNIARSVVVFDEVQTLPFPLLDPILSAWRELRDGFGVSFLLSSATQPRFEHSNYLPCGLASDGAECHEIQADTKVLFSVFRRARLELPCLTEPPWTWETIAEKLASEPHALIIVNLRQHAQDLFDTLKSARIPGLFHLSSTMCAAHRERKLGRKTDPEAGSIYHALQTDQPCVVVSTQVVEAGVDLDFPVVFRALGPLDAVIQAAGRCDRDGKRTRAAGQPAGRVVVFKPAAEPELPLGYYQTATESALKLLEAVADDPQRILDDPALFAKHHQSLISLGEGHALGKKIQEARSILNYPEVAELFRMIDSAGQGIVVRFGDVEHILERARRQRYISAAELRALQRFTVNLYPTWLSRFQADLRPVFPGEGAPIEYLGDYDEEVGLRLGELPAEAFCV